MFSLLSLFMFIEALRELNSTKLCKDSYAICLIYYMVFGKI